MAICPFSAMAIRSVPFSLSSVNCEGNVVRWPRRGLSFRQQPRRAEQRRCLSQIGESKPASSQSLDNWLPGADMGHSVGGESVNLVYKPYMDYFWMTLQQKVPELHCLPLEEDTRIQFSRKGAKKARVLNWLFAGDRMRRARLTYFDAGAAGQAFNALIYPEFRFNVPMLGIDLIALGANKILCVIDFIPITQDPGYLQKYTDQLAPAREKFSDLCGQMTTRFYDENLFFSKQLIFYRSTLGIKDPVLEVPNGRLFNVYIDYVDAYWRTLFEATEQVASHHLSGVACQQAAYNKYSGDRDPALKLFSNYFGEETLDDSSSHLHRN